MQNLVGMIKIYPVILSGGAGSRLWPLSRNLFPKQLLPLAGKRSLIQDTALRAAGEAFANPVIVCNVEHRFLIAEQMRAAGINPLAIILEPVGRNTAPAATAAALMIAQKDPQGIVLLMPADHIVMDHAAFLHAVSAAASAANHDDLVTFGITPRSPETGYGYIQRGEPRHGSGDILSVKRFVEKPDLATAQTYVASGEYLWNSGMFAFKASAYLAELAQLEPKLLEQCRAAMAGGKRDLDFFRLAAEPFAACRSISIDYAVMERTAKAGVIPVEMGWSDIGSWESLWESSVKDAAGNAVQGDVLQVATHNSYLRSDGPLVAAVGVDDLVVVATVDAVLVAR